MSWTVVIPSKDPGKVRGCIDSLLCAQPDIKPEQIVVVSDGLPLRLRWELRGVRWVRGTRPFVFARAINAGAEAADPESDIVILGDDVRIDTVGAFDKLALESVGAAAVAPVVSGVCGQVAQRTTSPSPRADWLTFICAYIPREAWNAIGPLDERFVGYGYDDVDWCLRASKHGPCVVSTSVSVTHLQDSSYRSQDGWQVLYAQNRERFEDKWGRVSA